MCIAAFVGFGIAARHSKRRRWPARLFVLVGPALAWIAVFLTAAYASRWVVLQLRTFRAQLADIDSRLEFLCERTGGKEGSER